MKNSGSENPVPSSAKGGWGEGKCGKETRSHDSQGGGAGVLLQRMLAEKFQRANLLRKAPPKKKPKEFRPEVGTRSLNRCTIWLKAVLFGNLASPGMYLYLLGQLTPPGRALVIWEKERGRRQKVPNNVQKRKGGGRNWTGNWYVYLSIDSYVCS